MRQWREDFDFLTKMIHWSIMRNTLVSGIHFSPCIGIPIFFCLHPVWSRTVAVTVGRSLLHMLKGLFPSCCLVSRCFFYTGRSTKNSQWLQCFPQQPGPRPWRNKHFQISATTLVIVVKRKVGVRAETLDQLTIYWYSFSYPDIFFKWKYTSNIKHHTELQI